MSSPTQPHIRRARLAEAALLTELIMRSKQSNGYDDAFMAACRQELTVSDDDLRNPEFWVAQADVVCGCASLAPSVEPGSIELSNLFVDPRWQGRGVGRLLWHYLRERATALGHTRVHLAADPNAEGFYRTLGFQTVGRVASGSIVGRTLPLMEQSLP